MVIVEENRGASLLVVVLVARVKDFYPHFLSWL